MEYISVHGDMAQAVDCSTNAARNGDNRHQTLIAHDNTVEDRFGDTGQETGQDGRSGDSTDFGAFSALEISMPCLVRFSLPLLSGKKHCLK